MKYITLVFIIICFHSCLIEREHQIIDLDLHEQSNDMKYSQFIKSLDYITLSPGDTCLLSGIQKLYFDGDTIIVQDIKKDGICVFTRTGQFIKQINYIGKGPTEYHNSNAISVDTVTNYINIYDIINFKINQYSYKGEFIASHKVEYFMRDFEVVDNQYNIMIQPSTNKVYPKNGVWITSPKYKFEKQLIEYQSNEQEFEFISTFYNKSSEGIFYYDRNNDNIYLLNKDSARILYSFDLKQKIPNKIRNLKNPNPADLAECAMMYDFSVSPQHIVLTYFIFEDENPFRWVFLDRQKMTSFVCNNFINDLDNIKSSDYRIFHLNDSTWCRVVDIHEKDCNTVLQIMHLKSSN